ncbi:hypothetical protein PHMEG_0009354 [Phytophthora megakarya]|uniref:Uncharacterized protein n=1 Tax=Phytophthora megakarya TaxID=4795 RepID=A0A225WH05_9STRA|nr:hypothetical protein PHMEG_0009354 [Phytophthora megakarya]
MDTTLLLKTILLSSTRRQSPTAGHDRDRVAKATLRTLFYLLSGRLLTKDGVSMHDDDDARAMIPLPIAFSQDQAQDEPDLPPTQVAQ